MEITRKFKTLHELSNFLIQLGNELKQMPDISLVEESKGQEKSDASTGKKPIAKKKKLDESKLDGLIARLQGMSRDEAEKELSKLTFKELRVVAEKYKISGSGRKSKKILLQKILYNLYDFKAGHELLRSFSSE